MDKITYYLSAFQAVWFTIYLALVILYDKIKWNTYIAFAPCAVYLVLYVAWKFGPFRG